MSNTPPKLDEHLAENRQRLRKLVDLRIDRRLGARIDASDIVQEAYAEAAQRFDKYLEKPDCSVFVWLRFITLQKLAQLHRHHVGVQARSVLKEAHPTPPIPAASSIVMADRFLDDRTSPLDATLKAERRKKVSDAIDALPELDREILAMRNFEGLSNVEAAEALGIAPDSAYKRYVRALKRFKITISECDLE